MTTSPAPATAAENPLLIAPGLPRFGEVEPGHVSPAITSLLADARATVKALTDSLEPANWQAFVEPLETATERLARAWGVVGHLCSVADTPELRAAFNENLPAVTQFWSELGQDRALCARYQALRTAADFASQPAARQRAIELALQRFRLGGVELESPARERFLAIAERHAALAQKFSENVLDATDAFELVLEDEARLAGLPDDARAAAREAAQAAGRAGWKFTLHFPSYMPVMQYADDRALREAMYRAYTTRASALAAAPADEARRSALDNAPIIDELLALRHEEAQLLGLGSYAELSLVPKMAQTPTEVIAFLRDLAARARPFAQRDMDELRTFARAELGLDDIQPWDTAWVSERLKQRRYAFSDQEVKQYLQLPRVLAGLYAQIERLFGVVVREDRAPVWHPDVRFYRIEQPDGGLVGQFYLDLYARAGKRPGAWMDDARGRRRVNAGVQTPVAYLTCNFQAPVGGQPATLTHDDVVTLFHEFGHGLHHMLTRVDELAVAGIAGVEWDAVELPSQFMENFCWEWPVVQAMSAHVQSGEPLPRALFDRMVAARNFQSGLQTLRQIEFGLFDMRLHAEYRPEAPQPVQALLDEVRAEVAVIVPPAFNRFQNSFSHIFAGGYSAGYYSYKWAEVLSADAYAAFEEAAQSAPADEVDQRVRAAGRRFLDEILAVGGSRPAIASFRAFRQREPRIDALLRHNGMVEESTHARAEA
jgi:oligopeptidase A